MVDNVTIERFTAGSWVEVANVTLAGDASSGISTATRTAYGINYAIDHLDRRDAAALSAAVPVSLDTLRSDRWPAFLVDLIPQGFGRAELLRRLGLPEDMGGQADWQLLLAGAGNPIGHLRVREAHEWLQEHRTLQPSSGFTFEEVAAGGDGFIETLGRNGMFVAGSSGSRVNGRSSCSRRMRQVVCTLTTCCPTRRREPTGSSSSAAGRTPV